MAALVRRQGARPLRVLGEVRRPGVRGGGRCGGGRSRRQGPGREEDHVPPARLGHLAPALLGHADPDHPLRRVRRGAGAREGPAGGAAGRLRAGRQRQPARQARGFRERAVPEVRQGGASARPTRWTRSSIRPGTTCATRAPTPTTMVDRRNDVLDADGPVHRRHRARDPAPALRALLDQGDARHGPRADRRAVHEPADAGHGAQPHLLPAHRQGRHRLLRARRTSRSTHDAAGHVTGARLKSDGQPVRVRRHRHDVEVEEERRRPAGHDRPVRRGHRRACS